MNNTTRMISAILLLFISKYYTPVFLVMKLAIAGSGPPTALITIVVIGIYSPRGALHRTTILPLTVSCRKQTAAQWALLLL